MLNILASVYEFSNYTAMNTRRNKQILLSPPLLLSFVFLLSCASKPKEHLFTKLEAAQSGIFFRNDIHDNDSSYSFINEFGYMGGGVGIGDFNNDGLKDIFFSGNQVSCRLYLNKSDNKFEDITEKAGITTNVWATGVSIVDINNDGYDDIYVCAFGKDLTHRAKNLLFINQHGDTFKEEATEYGLADSGYSTQAAFFDYDRDGDLDMYLANYLLTSYNANSVVPKDRSGRSLANDKLYRNDGDLKGRGHPIFTDVTVQAGIMEDGYGLGLSVSDLNSDGWPDVYVANDFLSNDELWLNNRNGTFTNCISESLLHQSYSSMGSDAADINNDGLPDIVTLDMLPEHNDRKKTSFFFMNYERYQSEREMGYEPEFVRNMLQLNNGCYAAGDTSIPFFSEIGQLAGISETDWSWSILMADFNNDGWKDMHITNGIGRDFINADFLEFSNQVFENSESKEKQREAIRRKLASLDHVNLSNYLYLNRHNYTFADSSETSNIIEPSMSNGAAFADLDNDGDLDLIVNNISKDAFVFINNTIQKNKSARGHFLSLGLKGNSQNKHGFGARVFLYTKEGMQMQEQNPVRGYFSSVDQQLLFGLGKSDHVDSLVVVWPDQKKQVLRNIATDTFLVFSWQNATDTVSTKPATITTALFSETSLSGISYKHHDNSFNDFAVQRLLPQKYSQLGPFMTTGDINKDGKTDFFIGGSFNFSGKTFIQQEQSFLGKNLIDSIKMEEDMDCVLFDADNDGNPDLLVTSGDVLYEENSIYYKPRLYFNDGNGNFNLNLAAIPDSVRTIAGCVSEADYDSDGDLDLFIGGRVSREYPEPSRSFLLQNNNGVFTDVTAKTCPTLEYAGMVTSAVWMDFDNDKNIDLVIAGEWMPVRFFKNRGNGLLKEVTSSMGLSQTNGLWRRLLAEDIDNDGDVDLIAGNLGLNCKYKVSSEEPMKLFAVDLDDNGSIDPILLYYIKDKNGERRLFPAINRNQFADQVPAVKKKFLLNRDYAHASFNDIFKGREDLMRLYCDETRSCYFENVGNGKFVKRVLPMEAQFAPVNAIICDDFDNDGLKDLLLAGNEYQTEVVTGRYDASYGCFLKGNNEKTFTAVPPVKSGFIIKGDVKDMKLLQLSNREKIILAAVNNDSLRVFRINWINK